MSILSKIEQNLEHDGIKVTLQSAQNLSINDPTLPIVVTVSNDTDTDCTINGVIARIKATTNTGGYRMALNDMTQAGGYSTDYGAMHSPQILIIAKAEHNEKFPLLTGENRSIPIALIADTNLIPTDTNENEKPKVDQDGYKYELLVTVNIEGMKHNPQAHQDIKIS
jgi:hypothetical protein